ncbi:MAG: hypothetical protein ACI8W8_001646 [Rhodothermales bacterium]|jgi:hypothetical protein
MRGTSAAIVTVARCTATIVADRHGNARGALLFTHRESRVEIPDSPHLRPQHIHRRLGVILSAESAQRCRDEDQQRYFGRWLWNRATVHNPACM